MGKGDERSGTLSGGAAARASSPQPSRVRIRLDEAIVEDLFGDLHDGCGKGRWCSVCRQEIRREALLWLRELNVLPGADRPEPQELVEVHPWHAHLMLAQLPLEDEAASLP